MATADSDATSPQRKPSDWFIPPIIVPALLVVLIAAYAFARHQGLT